MSPQAEEFTIGVEEEFQIIDSQTRELRSQAEQILAGTQRTLGQAVQPEVQLSQIETVTPVCRTLADVRAELVRLRRGVITAAAKDGNQIAAAGTHPFSSWEEQRLAPKERYRGLMRDYQQLTRELVIFGCHVHVGLRDREVAIQVINRSRVWLATLLALTANSPFWLGADTGYASFRTELWSRWPMAGPPLTFKSRAEYDALVQALTATGTIKDATKIYWDIRPSERFETIEFRVADVCMTVDETVMIAGLIQALVQTCYEQVVRDEPFPSVRFELLRAAHWQAARYGLDANLIDVLGARTVPAHQMVEMLLTFVRPSLEARGEWQEVSSVVQEICRHGTGATRQRQIYHRTGRLEDVVDFLVKQTAKGVGAAD